MNVIGTFWRAMTKELIHIVWLVLLLLMYSYKALSGYGICPLNILCLVSSSYFPLKQFFVIHTDGNLPHILQFASENVISVEDCQDDHSYIDEQHICIRDSSGQEGACFVRSLLSMMDNSAVHYPFKKHNITWDKKAYALITKPLFTLISSNKI